VPFASLAQVDARRYSCGKNDTQADARSPASDGGEGVRNHRISVDRTLRAAGWVALLFSAILLMEGTRLLAPAVVFVAAVYGGIGALVEAASSLVFGSRLR
jgi:hypothetical protein